MKKSQKKFRLNATVHYCHGVTPDQYRPYILGMMKHFAWLFQLEYATSEENPMPCILPSCGELQPKDTYDMVYFRSTETTQIQAKDLRMIIFDTFGKSFLWSAGVDVGCQQYKLLGDYPFPKKYFRLLNYPYIEIYQDGNPAPTICILAGEYYNFLDTCEQISPQSN